MIILKIKDRGLYLEIPGLSPTRTPVEVDISKCNLSMISVYLRKQGISDYEIYSKSDITHEKKEIEIQTIGGSKVDNSSIEKRFSKLELMMSRLLKKEQGNDSGNSEQINRKLETIEKLALKLLDKEPLTIQGTNSVTKVTEKSKDPEIEELDEKFIPYINTSNMKLKGGGTNTQTINRDKTDLDDSVDLLSRLIDQED